MKNKHIQKILLILTFSIVLLAMTACANETDPSTHDTVSTNDTINSETEQQSSNSTTEQIDETEQTVETEQIDETESILADLNHDGTDDKIIITYDDEQQSSATIQVINGADNSELMSDALTLGGNKIGAYYLQLGKGNIRDSLVSWHYEYLEDGKLYFYYSVFSFEADGNITYSARGGDTFNVSNKSSAIRGNEKFLVMIKKLLDNIDASCSYYNGYLLLDNQGDSMLISTADNMLTPTELTFELEDFVIESEGE